MQFDRGYVSSIFVQMLRRWLLRWKITHSHHGQKNQLSTRDLTDLATRRDNWLAAFDIAEIRWRRSFNSCDEQTPWDVKVAAVKAPAFGDRRTKRCLKISRSSLAHKLITEDKGCSSKMQRHRFSVLQSK